MQFTPEQARAIFTHNKNLIVTAGAGSGKTRVLVERFLALLDQYPDWQLTELVAITFTEKAAREMRERIRDALHIRIQQASSDVQRWQNHASLLDQARIGTIHSLCAQLLRANPAQVPIDPAFEVLDENEAYLLRSEAVEKALAEIAGQEAGNLLLYYGVRNVRDTLLNFAIRATGQAFIDALPPQPDDLIALWSSWYETAMLEWLNTIQSDTEFFQALDWQPPQGWPDPEDKLMPSWELIHHWRSAFDSNDPEAIRLAIETLSSGIRLQGGTAKNWGGKEIVDESKAVLRAIRDDYLNRYLLPAPLTVNESEAAQRIYLWAEAIQIAMNAYDELKVARSVVDFDDLESLTADLLRKHSDVRARYAGLEYKHMMVDEFQDTNTRQREIIYALCGIDPNISDNPQGRLFVVGDPKQSIYAFRGADVSVFNAVREEILSMGGEEVPLSRSFRTHGELVAGFNGLFQNLMKISELKYEVAFGVPMSAERQAESFHQFPIQILTVPKTDRFSKADELRQWEAYEIAQTLHRLKNEQIPVYDRSLGDYRPFDYGDAALLFRSLGALNIYEDVLKTQGIPYLTLGGRGYYGRQEVWDMLNLLKALHNPADNLALASVLRSPMFGLSDDGLLILRLCRDAENQALPLWEALTQTDFPYLPSSQDQDAIHFAHSVLSRLRSVAGRITVDKLIEMALDETAYDAILTALPDGDRRRENLDKLLEKAQASGRVSLSEFMLYVQDLTSINPRESEALVESAGVVQLMTVHASKGLEFPVVFIPNAHWERGRQDMPPLIHDPELGVVCLVQNDDNDGNKGFAYGEVLYQRSLRDLAESKRLLYVAMTRAQDYLFVTGNRPKAPNQSWLGLIDLVTETGTLNTWLTQLGVTEEPDPAQLDNPPIPRHWETPPAAPLTPPLLANLPIPPTRQVRHLSVSQLEQLGEARQSERGKQFFRHSVLHDAPPPLRPLQQDDRAPFYVQRRLIGRVVHRALQLQIYKRFSHQQIYQFLETYAWNEGVTEKNLLEEIVREAQILLNSYQEPTTLANADIVLREVPFIYRVKDRILHGAIDVLYQYAGEWYILDYKTAIIQEKWVNWHAQRYQIQLGAYAQAVQERTQSHTSPTVQLYYLHLNKLVTLTGWENELARLDLYLEQALEK